MDSKAPVMLSQRWPESVRPADIVMTALLVICIFYVLTVAVYRLAWHPLASFPGPKLAALTKWYECFYDTCKGEGGQYVWKVQQMHKRYGPIVRVNPDEIHIQDPSFFDSIFAASPARRDKYGPAAAIMFCPLGTFGTVKHDIHRKRRLANSALFSQSALRDAHTLIYERAEIICQDIRQVAQTGRVLHIHSTLLAFTTDVISAYVLGRPFGCQGDAQLTSNWYHTMRSLKQLIPLVKQFPWALDFALKLPLWLVRAFNPKLGLVLGMYWDMHDEARLHASNRLPPASSDEKLPFSKVKKPAGKRMTVFEAIDKSSLPLKEKDIARQAQEAFVLISAGTETAANTIGVALYYLVANPGAMTQLRSALSAVMTTGEEKPRLAVLESLPYLTAVIKETLRIQQLMTTRFPLVAPNELRYQEWVIPAGTPTSMTISEVLMDPAIFPQPYVFRPERWLDMDENGAGTYTLHNRLDRFFVPFGRGTRMCQGKDLAWAEMYICISQLIRKFDFELYDTVHERDVAVVRDCFLGTTTEKSPGIRMKIKRVLSE